MVHDRFPNCCQVRRLFCRARCPVPLCYPAVYGQAGAGLICTLAPILFQRSRGHSRMIKYSAGWELGARRLFTRGFLILFFSHSPFSSLSPTMFVHSCVHQCDYNGGKRSALARTYVTDWLTESAASIKHQNALNLQKSGNYFHVGPHRLRRSSS